MMRLLLLGLLASGLMAVILHELDEVPTSELRSLAAPRNPPPAPPPATDQSRDWITESLARPLFNPDRRPAPVTASGAAGDGPAEPPRLTGILVTSVGRQAIFFTGDRALTLREGGSIGGFTVQSIAGNHVILSGPAGIRLLRPSFGPAGGEGGDRAAANRPTAGTAAAFAANPAPSGLDILRNAERQANDAPTASQAASRPVPGLDALSTGFPAPALAPAPRPGRPGAPPAR